METSVFAEKNLHKQWKRPFRNKNASFNTKTRFSRRKEYFTSEIVFYSGILSFCREKNVEISCFFSWKRPFRNKNASFNIENEVFS